MEGVASLSSYAVEFVCHEQPARLESFMVLIECTGVVARLEGVAPLSECVVELVRHEKPARLESVDDGDWLNECPMILHGCTVLSPI